MKDAPANLDGMRWSRCACCRAVVGRRAWSIETFRGKYEITCGSYYCVARVAASPSYGPTPGLVDAAKMHARLQRLAVRDFVLYFRGAI